MKSYELNRELKKWDERVTFNVQFKPNTKANLDRLDTILFNSLEHFVTIAANSEALTYKIGRYFISKNIRNDEITFFEGKTIASYIGDESAEWKKKERLDVFFQIFGEQFNKKWVIIPYMSFEISIGLAIYFITQFNRYGATGLIMYAEGPSNIIETLCLESEDPYFYQFPKAQYKVRRREIQDDEY